ncbi:hypothetical protein [Streptomyces sp. NPDC059894]|uniref:hypothetical protein n=1 Tax=unclassified Streptomyces TaxID=2593676 RepID=UPI003650AC1B
MHRRGARTVLRGPRRSNAPGLPGGRLPVGYDLGLLHAYSLAAPATAARIRCEFAHVLDTDAGRTGELVALAQLLQACSRGVHPTLAPLIARRAQELTHSPVPTH